MSGLRGLMPGAQRLGGNSSAARQERPHPIFGCLSELCSPLVSLERQGMRAGCGVRGRLTIWQEDGPDLDLL